MSLRPPDPRVHLKIVVDGHPQVIVATPDGKEHDLTQEFVDVKLSLDATGCTAQLTGRFALDEIDVRLDELALVSADADRPEYGEFMQLFLADQGYGTSKIDVLWDYFVIRGLAPARD